MQIGLNSQLKDSTYKTLEIRFQNVPIFGDRLILFHENLKHWSAALSRKAYIVSDGVSEFAIVTVIVMTMTIPCSPMTRHLFATITVASTDKELCIDPSKCYGND